MRGGKKKGPRYRTHTKENKEEAWKEALLWMAGAGGGSRECMRMSECVCTLEGRKFE